LSYILSDQKPSSWIGGMSAFVSRMT
jgi:hypothetical protein